MSRLWNALKTQPPQPDRFSDDAQRRQAYRQWRLRTMYAMMVGYAVFYFCRKNLSVAMPAMLQDLGATKTQLGWILTGFSIVYGVSKFVNGVLADRANPRYFMALGLCCSALVNLAFGTASALTVLGLFWILNGWFQGMGWPPCARLLVHWFSPTELGTKWGIWNASHQIGGAGILILGGYLTQHYGWRSVFFGPALIAVAAAIFLVERLRDTPESVGLPPVEVYRGDVSRAVLEESTLPFHQVLFRQVLTNPLVWYVCFANAFVYIVRIGVLDWAPTFLVEAKQSTIAGAGLKTAGFEISGIVGAIVAGWLSDRVFKGRRGPVNVLFMLAVTLLMIGFWKVPPGHPYIDAVLLFAVGFVIYGPQMLVGVAATDFATKQAAATASGLTGTFGYLGSAVCGVGTGWIVDHYGWNGGFIFFIVSAVIGMLLFLLTWHHRSPVLEAAAVSSTHTAPLAVGTP